MEIEIRAKISNPRLIKEKLKKMGAKFLGEKEEKDIYFSSIELCKKLGYSFVVRIRKRERNFILTAKSAKKKIDGVWEEYEVPIKEPKIYINMFKLMGLEKVITVSKKRATFKLNGFTINIDKFKKWGNFIEIECISSRPKDKKKLFDLAKKLGIERKNIFEKGYISFFLEKLNSSFRKYIKN